MLNFQLIYKFLFKNIGELQYNKTQNTVLKAKEGRNVTSLLYGIFFMSLTNSLKKFYSRV